MEIIKKRNINKWKNNHRPWPLPNFPWVLKQTWKNTLFVHYPVKREVLQKLVPEVLSVDTFNETGWVSIVPYELSSMRLRGLPPIPGMNHFPGLNVRTYVTVDGIRGVYFFSLDAANWLAAKSSKITFKIPYLYAVMKMSQHGEFFNLESKRQGDVGARFECSYRPNSVPFYAVKDSIEEWLIERYCFYTVNRKGQPLRCDILHEPWLLQYGQADIRYNSMLSTLNIRVENNDPILHFSKKLEVRIWPLVSTL